MAAAEAEAVVVGETEAGEADTDSDLDTDGCVALGVTPRDCDDVADRPSEPDDVGVAAALAVPLREPVPVLDIVAPVERVAVCVAGADGEPALLRVPDGEAATVRELLAVAVSLGVAPVDSEAVLDCAD